MAARAKVILFGHRRWTVRCCVGGQLFNLFCASGWQFCSTEVELFVLTESSYSVDFALQFGKAWNRSFVGRDIFCNTSVFIRDKGLCLLWKRIFNEINPSFR